MPNEFSFFSDQNIYPRIKMRFELSLKYYFYNLNCFLTLFQYNLVCMKLGILLLLLLLIFVNPIQADSRLQFRNIGFKEGLNNMNVSSITQDHLGYIWVATMGGVSRYNGYEFKPFYFDSSNPASLSSNHTSSIFCSSDGLIYIGTAFGIDCYDNQTDQLFSPFPDFKNVVLHITEHQGYIYLGTSIGLFRFIPGQDKLEELGSNLIEKPMINYLLFDKNGTLWCGMNSGKGLASYDLKSDRFDFFMNDNSTSGLNQNSIRTLFQANDDVLLVGTKGGICYFNLQTHQFTKENDFQMLQEGVNGYDVRFIMEKEPSIYWVGTLQEGLFIYDKARKTLIQHLQDDGFPEIHSNNYQAYYTDNTGNIWLGTFDAGLDVSFKQARNFNFDATLNQLTKNVFITSIASDRDKNLIITTRENGFWVFNPESKKHRLYNHGNSGLNYSNIRTVFVDSENKYWLGIYFGLQIFNPENKKFTTVKMPQPNNGAVSIIQIDDQIFVGTDGQGLLVFDLKGKLIHQFLNHGSNIPTVLKLNDHEILLVSYGAGLFAMDFNNFAVRRIELADVKKYPGLLFAFNAYKDKTGKVWVGTYNYGLYSFDFINNEIHNYNIREGMPSSDAIGIEEDENSNLWISTSYGLVKLNKSDFKIKTYFYNEGVNNYQFHGKAAYKDKQGIIYFGGNSGLTYFNPDEIIQENSDPPRVVLENLYVQNRLVSATDEKSILTHSLSYTKEITLTHKDQIFTIDFVSFDFVSPEKVQYFYMLEGFDNDWYSVGTQRRVSYSNLPRGKYVFKVKSVNHAGVNSENEAELMIRVVPAFWYSYTAWAFYLAILAGISYFIFSLRIKNFVYKKNLEVEYSEHLREREINVMKQKFFTNISHELRTPLTLIYGLVTQLSTRENLSPQMKEFAQSLDLNVNRLLKLINQLLSFKKLEGETLSLWLENRNLNDALQRIIELFKIYSKEKEISIDLIEYNSYDLWFDYDKIEKIVSNLLGNSIKHSQKGGTIEVAVKKLTKDEVQVLYQFKNEVLVGEYIEISVTDNGTGIDEKDWSTIFDRYKQVESDGMQRPDYSGTGIGLNFTKSLVELHKGFIRLESKIGRGSTFSFILPIDVSVYEPKDFADSNRPIDLNADSIPETDHETIENKTIVDSAFDKTILVVEDDLQLNKFLVDILKNYYNTISAYDGEKGLKMVKQDHPDLVISDVMMPKKDGYELTKNIKENRELCHIPVVLLTAKSETDSQIEGMQSGADYYIPKPFNVDFLLAAIDSQLKNRKRIQEIFLQGQMPNLEKSDINQLDIQFLSKLNSFLEKELSNSDLNIQIMAQNMNLSRSVFYRKFMSLTKLSPITYIKKYRINKSVELMNTGKYTLTEIGEMTGFGSPSYFSTAFKQEKGVSPREFVNQLKDLAASEQSPD